MGVHIFHGIFVDHIVHLPCTQEFKEIDPALAVGTLKPSKKFIANMGTIAVFPGMARSGIIDVNMIGNF